MLPGEGQHTGAPSPPVGTPAPVTSPSPSPGATATSTPTQALSARIPSTVGRVGLVQVFDYHNGYMANSTISKSGRRYDAVWASLSPAGWDAAHPGMVVSNYYIMGLDQYAALHHTLAWWKATHPDWILYACTASGTPTHDIAYMIGLNSLDVPIDIHTPAAVAYQVQAMAHYAKAAGYNSLAVDQVVYWNIYQGGNPAFGQHRNTSEYGCGTWHGSTFVRDYASPKDPRYPADVVSYVRQAHSILHSMGMALVINHPGGSPNDPNEQQLLSNTDAVMDETGFSDYGRYTQNPGVMSSTLAWMRFAQSRGAAVMIVNKYLNFNQSVTGAPFEYALATYLLGNQGAALLFVGGAHGYGTLQYHTEYDAPIGKPCSDVSAGPVYVRRFSGGLAAVNGSTSTRALQLPSGKAYRDIEGHSIGSTIAPMSGYVLLTSANGCT